MKKGGYYLLGLALALGAVSPRGVGARVSRSLSSSLDNYVTSVSVAESAVKSSLPEPAVMLIRYASEFYYSLIEQKQISPLLPEAIGSPSRGNLKNGQPLESDFTLEKSVNCYGTAELIGTIEQAARAMYRRTGAQLVVNDLSREQGGKFRPHRSHQNGLDADIGHYFLDDGGRYYSANKELNVLDSFELDLNWHLIVCLQQGLFEVDEFYWSSHYIRAMKQYVKQEYGMEVWQRYGSKLKGWRGHTRHLHVRMKEVSQRNGLLVTENETELERKIF